MGAVRQIDSNERRMRPSAAAMVVRLPGSTGRALDCAGTCIIAGLAAAMMSSIRIPFEIGGPAIDHQVIASAGIQGPCTVLPYLAFPVMAGLFTMNRPKRRNSHHDGGRV